MARSNAHQADPEGCFTSVCRSEEDAARLTNSDQGEVSSE
jgi:hypothetical protein